MILLIIITMMGVLTGFLSERQKLANLTLLSPASILLNVVWFVRLKMTKVKVKWAYERLTTQRFWNETRSTALLLIGGLVTAVVLVPARYENITGMLLGAICGVLAFSLIQAAFKENRIAFNQQDENYLEAVKLLPQMPKAQAEEALAAAYPEADVQMKKRLLDYGIEAGLNTTRYKLDLGLQTNNLLLLAEVFEESPETLTPQLDRLLASSAPDALPLGMEMLEKLPLSTVSEVTMRVLKLNEKPQLMPFLAALAARPALIAPSLPETLLQEKWPRLRLAAARLMEHPHNPSWAAAIQQHLPEEPDEETRLALMKALGNLPQTTATLRLGLQFTAAGYSKETRKAAMLLLKDAAAFGLATEVATHMADLLVQRELTPSVTQLAIETLEAMGPDVLPGLLTHLEQSGHPELLHPHLPVLNLAAANEWNELQPAARKEGWAQLMDRLRQADAEKRELLLMNMLEKHPLHTKKDTLAEIIQYPGIRLLPVLHAMTQDLERALRKNLSLDGNDNLTPSERKLLRELQELSTTAATKCVTAQHPALSMAARKAYCLRCRCRCVEAHFQKEMYARCPRCLSDRHALANIAEVIGRIGGELPAANTKTLYLNLWDEAQKTAYPAEVDILEVAPDPTVTHEWALAVLLETTQQAGFSLSGRKIRLLGDIRLSTNSQRLLQEAGIGLLTETDETKR